MLSEPSAKPRCAGLMKRLVQEHRKYTDALDNSDEVAERGHITSAFIEVSRQLHDELQDLLGATADERRERWKSLPKRVKKPSRSSRKRNKPRAELMDTGS